MTDGGHCATIKDGADERKKRTALAGRSGSKRTEKARENSDTIIKLNCADTGACAESLVATPLYSIDESHESKTAHRIEKPEDKARIPRTNLNGTAANENINGTAIANGYSHEDLVK